MDAKPEHMINGISSSAPDTDYFDFVPFLSAKLEINFLKSHVDRIKSLKKMTYAF
jgi:hypothetical protein